MTKIDTLIRTAAAAVDRVEAVRLALPETVDRKLLDELDSIEADLRAAWTDTEFDLGRLPDCGEGSTAGVAIAAILAGEESERLAYLEAGETAAFPADNGLIVTIERADAAPAAEAETGPQITFGAKRESGAMGGTIVAVTIGGKMSADGFIIQRRGTDGWGYSFSLCGAFPVLRHMANADTLDGAKRAIRKAVAGNPLR